MQSDLKKESMDLVHQDLVYLKKKMASVDYLKDGVQMCSILNAKCGLCPQDCKFCAQSKHYDTLTESYPLISAESIVEKATEALQFGIHNFGIVTSGSTLSEIELDKICRAIEEISSRNSINICASLGTLSLEQLHKLKSSGLKRYHHNLETSKNFFPKVCTTHSWEKRVETVKLAMKVGLEVCSGGLFGIGESWEDRIDLAVALKKLNVPGIPINFLSAIPGTPMANNEKLTPDEALKIIAIYRHILPDKTIRICGGRPAILAEKQNEIYEVGANAVMTGDYLTIGGIPYEQDRKQILKHYKIATRN